jgi:inosose dehydratase
MRWTRRDVLAGLGAGGLAGLSGAFPFWVQARAGAAERLYPPKDLSVFALPLHRGAMDLRVGCAAITWNGNDRQAIDDISALGYPGIQLRANAVTEFPDPHALASLVAEHKLTFVALSSGDTTVDSAKAAATIEKHAANARYLQAAGGKYLQVIGSFEKLRNYTQADYKQQGEQLTAIGKRAAEYGIQTGFHNHMGSIGQSPEAVDAIMAASDPRYVKLELDVAHYLQAGGDPAAAIRKYRDRLLFLHLKDVESAHTRNGYQFVELGQGRVNFQAIDTAVREIHFRGWGIVELDGEREGNGRTPKQSAEISKQFLEQKMGVRV